MKNQYKYIYESDLTNISYDKKEFSLIPLFIDFKFEDLNNNNIPYTLLVNSFLVAYQKDTEIINKISYEVFKKNIIIKNDQLYLNSSSCKDSLLKNIDKLIIFIIYTIMKGEKKIIVPFSHLYNDVNNPFYVIDFLKNIKLEDASIIFISDDLAWLSVHNKDIVVNDIYWIEGEFDRFTYNFFKPEYTYKIAGNWLNIIKILEKNNPHHYGIIDKDGFTIDNRNKLSFHSKLFISKYAECENIWISENILEVFEKNVKEFSKKDFIKEVITQAKKDKNDTIKRFINRQIKLHELNLPYHDNNHIKDIIKKYENDLNKNKYDDIIYFYDNKSIFNLLLKNISCKNIKSFYNLVYKLKKDILMLKINPII